MAKLSSVYKGDYSIRSALPSDAEAFLKYRTQLIQSTSFLLSSIDDHVEPSVEAQARIIEKYLKADHDLFLLLTFKNEIVGSLTFKAGIHNKNRHSGGLGMGILPQHQDRHNGHFFMETLLNILKNQKEIKRVDLDVMANNDRAIHLYKKFGFEIEGTKKFAYKIDQNYVDSIIMGKIINF